MLHRGVQGGRSINADCRGVQHTKHAVCTWLEQELPHMYRQYALLVIFYFLTSPRPSHSADNRRDHLYADRSRAVFSMDRESCTLFKVRYEFGLKPE